MTASQRSAISRRRSAGRGLGERRLGRALHLVAALAQQALDLVQEHVAARLADVEQGDPGAGAGGQRVGQRAAGGLVALGRRVEDDQAVVHRHGSTETLCGEEPISPAAHEP